MPTPVSPVMRTLASERAAHSMSASMARMASLRPTSRASCLRQRQLGPSDGRSDRPSRRLARAKDPRESGHATGTIGRHVNRARPRAHSDLARDSAVSPIRAMSYLDESVRLHEVDALRQATSVYVRSKAALSPDTRSQSLLLADFVLRVSCDAHDSRQAAIMSRRLDVYALTPVFQCLTDAVDFVSAPDQTWWSPCTSRA